MLITNPSKRVRRVDLGSSSIVLFLEISKFYSTTTRAHKVEVEVVRIMLASKLFVLLALLLQGSAFTPQPAFPRAASLARRIVVSLAAPAPPAVKVSALTRSL